MNVEKTKYTLTQMSVMCISHLFVITYLLIIIINLKLDFFPFGLLYGVGLMALKNENLSKNKRRGIMAGMLTIACFILSTTILKTYIYKI